MTVELNECEADEDDNGCWRIEYSIRCQLPNHPVTGSATAAADAEQLT